MKCGIWNQMKIWSSHLLDNLSNCLMNLKNSGDSTGLEPMTSAMPVQCSNQLSYEVIWIYFIQVDFAGISSDKISIRRFLLQERALSILGLEKNNHLIHLTLRLN